jgi:transcriptional regulator with XRE-family HTH domain
MDQVAERLAELRERRALTLRELSDMSGVAADTINQIELGHRKARPSTLRKLAKALNVEVSDFFREPALPLAKAPREAGPKDEETPTLLVHAAVLERIADLWDEQLSRGFYDERTLRMMHTASFVLAMNHEGTISEEDRESLTPNLLEQLEAAEERLVAVDSRIWEVLEKTSRGYTAPPDELAARREAKRQQLRGGRHARHG